MPDMPMAQMPQIVSLEDVRRQGGAAESNRDADDGARRFNLNKVEAYFQAAAKEAFEIAKESNEEVHRKIAEWRKMYDGSIERSKVSSSRSQLWPNMIFEAVDTLVPQVHQMVFPSDMFFDVDPQDRLSFEKEANAGFALVQQGVVDSQFVTRAMDVERESGICGTAICQRFWQNERRKARIAYAQTPTDETLREIQSYLGPNYTMILPERFFPCDAAEPEMQKQDFVALRFYATDRSLRANQRRALEDGSLTGYYVNLDLLKNVATSSEASNDKQEQEKERRATSKLGKTYTCVELWFQAGVLDPISDESVTEGDIEQFLQMYGVSRQDLEGAWVVTLAEGDLPIRIQPNPYMDQDLPFLAVPFIPRKDSFWGIGIPEIVESDQYELATKVNQAVTATDMNIKRIWLAVKGVIGQDASKWQVGRETSIGTIIELEKTIMQDLGSAVIPVSNDVNIGELFGEADRLMLDIQRRVGAVSTLAGAESAKAQTATEIAARSRGAYGRVGMHAEIFERYFIKPMIQAYYRMYQQFLMEPEALWIIGEKGVGWNPLIVSPEDIVRDLRFNPMGTKNIADRMAYTQQVIQLLGIPYALPFVKVPKILSRWFRVQGENNPEELVIDPTEVRIPTPVQKQHELFAIGRQAEVPENQSLEEIIMELGAHRAIWQSRILSGEISDAEHEKLTEHTARHLYYLNQIAQQSGMAMGNMLSASMMSGGGGQNLGDTARQGNMQVDRLTGPNSPSPGGLGRVKTSA